MYVVLVGQRLHPRLKAFKWQYYFDQLAFIILSLRFLKQPASDGASQGSHRTQHTPQHIPYDATMRNQSIHASPVSAKFLKPWSSFPADIRDALQNFDLNGQVSLLDPCKGEQYLTGNKPGLTAQFIRNLCAPVTEALLVTSFRGLMLGDIHAVGPSCWEVPDVMLVQLEDPTQPDRGTTTLVTSGEIKAFWIFEQYPIGLSVVVLSEIGTPVGKENCLMEISWLSSLLIGQAIKSELEHGFLSTYKTTIFIPRVADFEF